MVTGGSCRKLPQPGRAGRCGPGTAAGCRSCPLLSGHRVPLSPSSLDCPQSREPSGTPRTPGRAAPGSTCGDRWESVLILGRSGVETQAQVLHPRPSSPDLLDQSVDVLREQQAADRDAHGAARCRLGLRTSKGGQEAVTALTEMQRRGEEGSADGKGGR